MRNDGGPAFPSHGTMGEVVQRGLSLRDYFAAAALQTFRNGTLLGDMELSFCVTAAYKIADAMLLERDRPKPPLEVTEEHREQGATDLQRAYPDRRP